MPPIERISRSKMVAPLVSWAVLLKPYLGAIFFLGGFLFDSLTLGRIDQGMNLFQLGGFVFFAGLCLALPDAVVDDADANIPLKVSEGAPMPKSLKGIWQQVLMHRDLLAQFFLGGLLSAFVVFYFKSASTGWPMLFVLVLVGLMVLNEIPAVHAKGFELQALLYCLCLCSFGMILAPLILRKMGHASFVMGLGIGVGFYHVYLWLYGRFRKQEISKKSVIQGMVVPILFLGLYAFKTLPPVPMCVQEMGVFHTLDWNDGQVELGFSRSPWRFWEKGAQTFRAGKRDRVYVFARVFTPVAFEEKVYMLWQRKVKDTWKTSDRIEMTVKGGREKGFRGHTYKQNHVAGTWRVLIETHSGREVGRIGFSIEPVDTDKVRDPWKVWKR